MAIFVEDIPHRRAFGPAALVVLPHPFIGAVVEIKEFQILELARRGAEQLLAQLDERVHRPADVEEQQQLDRVAPLRAHADVEPALPRGAVDRTGDVELVGRAFARDLAQTAQRDLDVAGAEFLEIGRAPSELQSLMRSPYSVFCLKQKKTA